MDQKYLPIPIADLIYNFVQIFLHIFTILWYFMVNFPIKM